MRTLSALFLIAALAISTGSAALFSSESAAQTVVREAPRDVRAARMGVVTPPEITLSGRADRLSPGARIRGTNNLLVLPATLAGQEVPVVFRRDAAGLVHEVWLLTEAEYARLGGSGAEGSAADGYRRFNELLALIFGAR